MASLLKTKDLDGFLSRGFSRRQVGRIASMLTAGAALPFYNEFAMAGSHAPDARGKWFPPLFRSGCCSDHFE